MPKATARAWLRAWALYLRSERRKLRRRKLLERVCELERELVSIYEPEVTSERTVVAIQHPGGLVDFYSTPHDLLVSDFACAIGFCRLRRMAETGQLDLTTI